MRAETTTLRRALRQGGVSTGLIKGDASTEPVPGYVPGYSASGQDIWLPAATHFGAGLVLSAVGARCGKVFLASGEWSVVANTVVLTPQPGHHPKFLWYLVNHEDFWEKGGTAQPYVRVPETLARRVWMPPLDEQRTIADYLDAETTRIDALIAKKQQLIHLLEERIAALVDAHFSPDHGEPTVRLARLATVQTGVTLNASKVNDGGTVRMPYLRVANVQPGRLDLAEVKEVEVESSVASRSMLRAGDVLMTEGGDIDKLGRGTVWRGEIENCLHQNHVFAVRPRPAQLDPDYLANVTRTSHARAYFESTGVQSTNLASTNSFKVADFRVPSLDIKAQRARCDSFQRSSRPLSNGLVKLQRQLELIAEHRQALITAVVTGEVRVLGAT